MPKPARVDFKSLAEGTEFKPGDVVDVEVDGESADLDDANRKTGLLIRVFYKLGRVPMREIILNKAALKGTGPNKKKFFTDPSDKPHFRAGGPGTYSIRVFAWDMNNKPANGLDHKAKYVRIRVR